MPRRRDPSVPVRAYSRRAPVDLPVEHGGRTVIHVELGVPISFDTRTAEFYASVRHVDGKGAATALHSPSFAEILARIRVRALVVPVRAYQVEIHPKATVAGTSGVTVTEVDILEYHPTRATPFIVQRAEGGEPYGLTRVYWPRDSVLESLERSVYAEREERARSAKVLAEILAKREELTACLHEVRPSDITHVQTTGEQEAAAGMASFYLEEDEEDDEQVTDE